MPDQDSRVAKREARRAKREAPKKPLVKRWGFWVIIAASVLVIVIALAGWHLASQVFGVKDDLEQAQKLTSQLKTEALDFDIESAQKTLTTIQDHTGRAVTGSNDPLWKAAEVLPVLGANLTAVRELSSVTDDLIDDVAAPLVNVAGGLNPADFAPVDGAINIQPIIDAVPVIAEANTQLATASTNLAKVDTSGTVDQIPAAKKKMASLIKTLSPVLDTLNTLVPLVPTTMGAEAPRKYVVMFQNNAELRALGGTALSFAVINIDQGRISFQESVPAGFKNFATSVPVLPQPDGVAELFNGELGNFIPNNTLRPSFTTAGQLTQEMWSRDQGYAVDGVISIDPVALSYVLRATGDIALSSGDVLTSDNLVQFLLNGVYLKYNSGSSTKDNVKQNAVYDEAVTATFGALTSGPVDSAKLIDAITQGWNERRILYWSSHEDEQARLMTVGLNGEIPVSDESTDRVGVYVADNVGSKLNYYLKEKLDLAQAVCSPDNLANYRMTAEFTSTLAPSQVKGLTVSITGTQYERMGMAKGVQRLVVMLYAPIGSQISGATVNGTPIAFTPGHDGDYPVARVTINVNPGTTVSVGYDVIAATPGERVLEAQTTPMVVPTPINKSVLDCATVAAR